MAAAKNSTVVLKVNLDCRHCHKKIRNAIYKLQLEEVNSITTISYDNKKQTVTISGPFDPKLLSKKLKCMTGRVIKDAQITEDARKPKKADKATQTGVHFSQDVINAEKAKKQKRQLQQPERGDALKKKPVAADDGPEQAKATRPPPATAKLVELVPGNIPYFWQPPPAWGGGRPCCEGRQGGGYPHTHCSYPDHGGLGYGVDCYPAPHKNVQFFSEDEDDQIAWCAVM